MGTLLVWALSTTFTVGQEIKRVSNQKKAIAEYRAKKAREEAEEMEENN